MRAAPIAQLRQIKAVRIALVIRSNQFERAKDAEGRDAVTNLTSDFTTTLFACNGLPGCTGEMPGDHTGHGGLSLPCIRAGHPADQPDLESVERQGAPGAIPPSRRVIAMRLPASTATPRQQGIVVFVALIDRGALARGGRPDALGSHQHAGRRQPRVPPGRAGGGLGRGRDGDLRHVPADGDDPEPEQPRPQPELLRFAAGGEDAMGVPSSCSGVSNYHRAGITDRQLGQPISPAMSSNACAPTHRLGLDANGISCEMIPPKQSLGQTSNEQ